MSSTTTLHSFKPMPSSPFAPRVTTTLIGLPVRLPAKRFAARRRALRGGVPRVAGAIPADLKRRTRRHRRRAVAPSTWTPPGKMAGRPSALDSMLTAHAADEEAALTDDPLPSALLSACRLKCMTEPELWAHDPPPPGLTGQPVLFVSSQNEWHALQRARGLARVCERPISLHEVDRRTADLCAAASAPRPIRRHAQHSAMCALLGDVGGSGAVELAQSARGRCLVSSRTLSPSDCALSIPAAALFSAASAASCDVIAPCLPVLRSEVRRAPSSCEPLAAYISSSSAAHAQGVWSEHLTIMLHLMHERSIGRASRWVRWLRLLPRDLHAASAWAEADLDALAATPAYWRAHAARGEMLELRSSLVPQLLSASPGLTAASLSETRWQWAKAVVDTRAISLPAPLGPVPAGGQRRLGVSPPAPISTPRPRPSPTLFGRRRARASDRPLRPRGGAAAHGARGRSQPDAVPAHGRAHRRW